MGSFLDSWGPSGIIALVFTLFWLIVFPDELLDVLLFRCENKKELAVSIIIYPYIFWGILSVAWMINKTAA